MTVRRLCTFWRYELLMHVRSWRLWLGLAALVAATNPWRLIFSVLRDPRAVDAVGSGFFVQVSTAGWIVFVPVLIMITVDTVARVRSTGVWPLVFTKPFSTLTFLLGCWLAVVTLAVFLAGTALAVRYLTVRYMLGLRVYAMPLLWLLALVALPASMALVALVIWVRTVFKHNVTAYLVSALLAAGLFAATEYYRLPLLGWSRSLLEPLLENYTPSIGRDLDDAVYGAAFLNTAALSLLIMALSGYHMRRQEPHRLILGRYGKRWSDMPTFLEFFANLRIDRHVGAPTHFLLMGAVVLVGVVGTRSVTQSESKAARMRQWAAELRKDLRESRPAVPAVLIRHYAGRLDVESRERLSGDVRMTVENTTQTAVAQMALVLPFGLEVGRLEGADGQALPSKRWGNVWLAELGGPLSPGSTTTVRIAYQGKPMALDIGEMIPFSDQYEVEEGRLEGVGVTLGRRYLCMTSWLLPRSVMLLRTESRTDPVDAPGLFTADLMISAPSRLELVSPDGQIERRAGDEGRTQAHFVMAWPRSDFLLLAAPYERLERRFGSLPLNVYCFREDSEVVRFVLAELSETVERWGQLFGPPRGSALALIETPFPASSGVTEGMWAGMLDGAGLNRLWRYRPLFEEREREGFLAVSSYQTPLSMALASRFLRESFHPAVEIAPLGESLFWYLMQQVRRSDVGPLARRSARVFAAPMGRDRGGLVDPNRHGDYRRPLIARMRDPHFVGMRTSHIWRMLHYLLEDDKFAQLIRALVQEYGDRLISLPDIEKVAERFYGEPLDWFFQFWFFGAGLPKYEILEARADMVENARTRDIEYDVRVVVANRGSGKMPAPVVVVTERDTILRPVWLDAGTTQALELRVPDRPELVTVDPQGWIEQEMNYYAESRSRGPAQRRVWINE